MASSNTNDSLIETPTKKEIIIQEYITRKQETISTMNQQYGILSMVIAASSGVLLFSTRVSSESNNDMLFMCTGLILPGIYSFFGVLWFDAVYRQRRAGRFIRLVEEAFQMNGRPFGWEHFAKDSARNRTVLSKVFKLRCYYHVCGGLFCVFPAITFIPFSFYISQNDEEGWNMYNWTVLTGGCLFVVCSWIFAYKYYKDTKGIMRYRHEIQCEKEIED